MTHCLRLRLIQATLLFGLGVPFAAVGSQQPGSQPTGSATGGASARLATRAELDAAASEFDRLAASTAYGERTRARARAQAVAARRRLTDGDFKIGDRIILRVQGGVTLDDTVTVLEDSRIDVRGIRPVSLAGVLRSELELKIRSDLSESVRNLTVSARPLMRMAVFGSVVRPGYLSVPAEATLDQLLSVAGGPTATAAMDGMKLMRADTMLVRSEGVLAAVSEGRTLDDLGLVDGDALVVPDQGPQWDRAATMQIVGMIVAPIITILLVGRR